MKNKQILDLHLLINELKKQNIQKIIVTGNVCTGKTTLAKYLFKQLSIPITHLDTIIWKENFVLRRPTESRKIINSIIDGPSWIIDGVSFITCEKAECIIFLDIPLYKILLRAIIRCFKSIKHPRPELTLNCHDWKVPHLTMKIIWNFTKLTKPKIYEIIKRNGNSKIIVIIRKSPILTENTKSKLMPT